MTGHERETIRLAIDSVQRERNPVVFPLEQDLYEEIEKLRHKLKNSYGRTRHMRLSRDKWRERAHLAENEIRRQHARAECWRERAMSASKKAEDERRERNITTRELRRIVADAEGALK